MERSVSVFPEKMSDSHPCFKPLNPDCRLRYTISTDTDPKWDLLNGPVRSVPTHRTPLPDPGVEHVFAASGTEHHGRRPVARTVSLLLPTNTEKNSLN